MFVSIGEINDLSWKFPRGRGRKRKRSNSSRQIGADIANKKNTGV